MGVLLVDASLFALLAGCVSLISHATDPSAPRTFGAYWWVIYRSVSHPDEMGARDKQRAEDVEHSADLS